MAWLHALVLASAMAGQSQAVSGSTAPADKPSKSSANAAKEEKPARPKASTAKKSPAKPAEKPPAKAAPKTKTGPRIMTQSDMQKPRSPFLMLPGSEGDPADRYSGPTDWRDIPPWRQAAFFGIRRRGDSSFMSSTVRGA